MTLPYALTVNAQFPFPSTVKGSGPVTISKANGIWTVGLTIAQLPPLMVGADQTTKLILIYDQVTQSFLQTTLSALFASVIGSVRIITVAGDVTVLSSDVNILLNKTVGAATNINLPASASRNGMPLLIKDYKGDANINNITLVPSGVETIDGFSGAAAAANGLAKITTNLNKKIIYPLPTGGWFL